MGRLSHELAPALSHLGFPDSDVGFERFIYLLSPELSVNQPLIVVMDDFHLINDHSVQDSVENLAKERLDGPRVFLLSREMPAFSITNLFLKNIIYFISQDDLRFTEDKAQNYFALLSLPVSVALCGEIMTQSEGRFSAIYLISLSLRQDPTGK